MAGAIVCGVDGSVEASEALLVARWLGERLAAPLVLVHAAGGLAESRRLLEQVRVEHGVRARLRPLVGDAAEALRTAAEKERARLIVVGTRGHGRLRTAVLGSVSGALTARAPCPVLAVPLGAAVPRFVRPAAAA